MGQLVPATRAQVRVSSLPLYDTCQVGGAATVAAQQIRLMQNGVGSNADGFTSKQLTETNLSRQGGLALGQSMRVHSVGVNIWKVVATLPSAENAAACAIDVSNLSRAAVLKYTSGELSQTFGPLAFFPGGGGVVANNIGSTGSSAATCTAIPNNGDPSPIARFKLIEPIEIEDGQSFAFVVDFPAALTMLATASTDLYNIQVSLYGITYQTVTS